MVVVSVSYKPEEEDAVLELLDSLKGSFEMRMSGTIDQIGSQMDMACYRCGGPVNFSKGNLPNDDIFMLYMLRKQDVTIESIPKMDVQILEHRSLSEKDESETPSSSKGSHILTEPVEHKKSDKKRTLENVPEQPNRKIPKIELPSALDDSEERKANAFRSMLVAKHLQSVQEPAGHSPSTSATPVKQDRHIKKEDSVHNISRAGDVKKGLLEDSLQDLGDKPTSTAACASHDSGVEVMKFQSSNDSDHPTATAEIGTAEIDINSQFDVDARHFVMPVAGLNNLNNMNVVVPKRAPRRRSAPAPVSVTKSLYSRVANIATVVHDEWHLAECKKCRKILKAQDGAGWKSRIKVSVMSHVRRHMTIQPFFCEFCQWGYNHLTSIDQHMMEKHPLDIDRFQDRRNQDSFIEEAAKVLSECFDSDPQ